MIYRRRRILQQLIVTQIQLVYKNMENNKKNEKKKGGEMTLK